MYSSMPSTPYPSHHAIETTSPPASPTSSTRPTGRLRGLSYLRNYTHTHILSRESHSGSNNQRPSVARATSYPSPTSTSANRGSQAASPTSPTLSRQISPTGQRSATDLPTVAGNNQQHSTRSTSGWLPTVGGQSGIASDQSTATASSTTVPSGNGLGTSNLNMPMARTRSATVGGATDMPQVDGGGDGRPRNESPAVPNGRDAPHGMAHQLPSIRFTAHQDPRAQRPSLVFTPMSRTLPTGKEVIKVGRYSERDNQPAQTANTPSSSPVGFKSKVVSRRHCEFWCSGGRWYIKDVKSSSGTFLNHIRLSSPGTESRPFPVNDGDIVQLGIDFKGGEEMIFRCVKIRVELNKGWQTGPSSFNVQSHKRLRELNNHGKPPAGGSSQDCSICLGPIAPCQSLFVAPCSHTWHFKCIRVIIMGPHWPHFICPNCRTVADLEAELDDPYADGEWEEIEAADNDRQLPDIPTETNDPPHEQVDNDAAHVEPEMAADGPEHDQSEPSDGEVVETSEDSDASNRVHQAAEEMEYLNIDDPPSPPSSASSHPPDVSNSTVQPLNIVNRKPVSGLSAGNSSRFGQSDSQGDRSLARTPSPSRMPSSIHEAIVNGEGPMTPRNDVGPFIFDGSAGRSSAAPVPTVAVMNLNAAANTPPPELESQPAS